MSEAAADIKIDNISVYAYLNNENNMATVTNNNVAMF